MSSTPEEKKKMVISILTTHAKTGATLTQIYRKLTDSFFFFNRSGKFLFGIEY